MTDPAHSGGMGRGMIAAAAILALAMLTWFFNGVLDRQVNPNRNPHSSSDGQIRVVTLEANRQHQYMATARLNGNEVDVLVDTGATDVAIAEPLARRLNLPRGQRTVISTANGLVEGYRTTIEAISVGDIGLFDIDATVVPNMAYPEVLLGMNFLRELEMTQSNGRLILRQ